MTKRHAVEIYEAHVRSLPRAERWRLPASLADGGLRGSVAMMWLAAMAAAMVLLPFVLVAAPGWAQPDTLRVATRVLKPFVIDEGGGNLSGFSIELWQEINAQLGTRTEYVIRPTVRDLLEATQNGEVDLAIAAISITEERERTWDFSQPMFEAGLQILIPEEGGSGGGIAQILGALLRPDFLPLLVFVILGAVVAGHVVWLFERRRPDGVFTGRAYFPSVFEAIFWATSTLATQAEMWPKSAVARVVSVIWMFTAVLFIAFFTAAVTSTLTVQQLQGDIKGPEDLPGKRVATLGGSTSAQYLTLREIRPMEFTSVEDAVESLQQGEADAVVYDAPVLQYYASHEGKGKVRVVGTVFRKESYGILFPDGSPYREPVNQALLRLRENGTYDRLLTKYFGGEGGKSGT
jgi:polar amino acid transport system substrate-binding protein